MYGGFDSDISCVLTCRAFFRVPLCILLKHMHRSVQNASTVYLHVCRVLERGLHLIGLNSMARTTFFLLGASVWLRCAPQPTTLAPPDRYIIYARHNTVTHTHTHTHNLYNIAPHFQTLPIKLWPIVATIRLIHSSIRITVAQRQRQTRFGFVR